MYASRFSCFRFLSCGILRPRLLVVEKCGCDDARTGARKQGGAWHHNDSATLSISTSWLADGMTYRLLSAQDTMANATPLKNSWLRKTWADSVYREHPYPIECARLACYSSIPHKLLSRNRASRPYSPYSSTAALHYLSLISCTPPDTNAVKMAPNNLPSIFNATSQDIEMLLAAQCHLGSKNMQTHMEPYLWKTRPDGINVINIGKTW